MESAGNRNAPYIDMLCTPPYVHHSTCSRRPKFLALTRASTAELVLCVSASFAFGLCPNLLFDSACKQVHNWLQKKIIKVHQQSRTQHDGWTAAAHERCTAPRAADCGQSSRQCVGSQDFSVSRYSCDFCSEILIRLLLT
jgi:hypothetical protein